MQHSTVASMLCGGLALLLAACGPLQSASTASTSAASATVVASNPKGTATAATPIISHPEGWTEATHGADAAPDYDAAFPQDAVKPLTITITPENWAAMQANMTELFGEPGSQPMGGPGGRPPGLEGEAGAMPADGQPPMPPDGAMPGGPGGPGGGLDMTPENPIWVAATVQADGLTWTNVGVRYKGNSSLRSAWGNGSQKLPLKLDFDEFEDEHPEILNQRFYGFQQLSLGNNFSDASGLRDTVAYDLLEDAGLVAAQTAFYDIVLDYGEGPVNLGIYTAVEVIDDTVIARAFGEDSGNIYEADGRAASLADGTFDQIEESFQKENNKKSGWSDIQKLYTVLHSPERTTDPATWRSDLESVFDVSTFLKWLALSGEMQHWDTYGAMSHNYYLYNNPGTGKLTWISWDHNMVLGSGPGAPGGGQARPNADVQAPQAATDQPQANQGRRGMGPGRNNVSLDRQSVTEDWPLIRYLLDDPTYYAQYVEYVEQIASDVFQPDRLAEKYQNLAELLAPYAERDGTKAELDAAIQSLTATTYERAKVTAEFLATQP